MAADQRIAAAERALDADRAIAPGDRAGIGGRAVIPCGRHHHIVAIGQLGNGAANIVVSLATDQRVGAVNGVGNAAGAAAPCHRTRLSGVAIPPAIGRYEEIAIG